jgi:hypothetical protein
MQTVTGLFDTYRQAEDAVAALRDAGLSSDDISIISRDSTYVDGEPAEATADGVGVGSGLGLVAGGGAGLLAGLGLMAIPGVGPVVAAGWLAATLAGAATGTVIGGAAGGLIGALTSANVKEEDAHVYAESVRRGGTLVTVRVHDDRAAEARAILDRYTPVDIEGRRNSYAESGWTRFDADQPPYTTPVDVADLDAERYRNQAGRR